VRIAYAQPPSGERYLVAKNDARRLVHAELPELELLAFQSFHGPNMDADLAYPVTFAARYIRLLSVSESLIAPGMEAAFREQVLPEVIRTVAWWRTAAHNWPAVVVALDGAFHLVSCSDGGLFPSRSETERKVRVQKGMRVLPVGVGGRHPLGVARGRGRFKKE